MKFGYQFLLVFPRIVLDVLYVLLQHSYFIIFIERVPQSIGAIFRELRVNLDALFQEKVQRIAHDNFLQQQHHRDYHFVADFQVQFQVLLRAALQNVLTIFAFICDREVVLVYVLGGVRRAKAGANLPEKVVVPLQRAGKALVRVHDGVVQSVRFGDEYVKVARGKSVLCERGVAQKPPADQNAFVREQGSLRLFVQHYFVENRQHREVRLV